MKTKLRLLLRSVYLKGHQDGNLKTSDLSWEDKIVKEIISLAKECAPEEKKIIEWDEDCTSTGNADDAYDHGMERGEIFAFNAGVKQFLANIEGEECIK